VAHAGQQPANLAILPLHEDNLEQRAVPLGFDQFGRLGGEAALGEVHPFLQLLDDFPRGNSRDLHAVDFLDAEPGVGEAVGQFAVVGDQQQPLAVFIEATDGEQPLGRLGKEVNHPGPTLGVAVGAEHPGRLVDQIVRPAMDAESLAIEPDILCVGIDAGPQFRDGLAIHGHPARGDVLFAAAAGPNAGHRQQSLQPHSRINLWTVAHPPIVAA